MDTINVIKNASKKRNKYKNEQRDKINRIDSKQNYRNKLIKLFENIGYILAHDDVKYVKIRVKDKYLGYFQEEVFMPSFKASYEIDQDYDDKELYYVSEVILIN